MRATSRTHGADGRVDEVLARRSDPAPRRAAGAGARPAHHRGIDDEGVGALATTTRSTQPRLLARLRRGRDEAGVLERAQVVVDAAGGRGPGRPASASRAPGVHPRRAGWCGRPCGSCSPSGTCDPATPPCPLRILQRGQRRRPEIAARAIHVIADHQHVPVMHAQAAAVPRFGRHRLAALAMQPIARVPLPYADDTISVFRFRVPHRRAWRSRRSPSCVRTEPALRTGRRIEAGDALDHQTHDLRLAIDVDEDRRRHRVPEIRRSVQARRPIASDGRPSSLSPCRRPEYSRDRASRPADCSNIRRRGRCP